MSIIFYDVSIGKYDMNRFVFSELMKINEPGGITEGFLCGGILLTCEGFSIRWIIVIVIVMALFMNFVLTEDGAVFPSTSPVDGV